MTEIKWLHPDTIAAVLEQLKTDDAVLHGGGTHLSGKRLRERQKLISLTKLHLRYIKQEHGRIRIGSLTDYNTIVRELQKLAPGHILTKSLSRAATNPLRNRITIGGSLRLAPNWSDLTGPLLALDAKVSIAGEATDEIPVKKYLESKTLKKRTLITEISIPDIQWDSWYYREGLTKNDHPVFTLTILSRSDGKILEDIAISITGHTKRFLRATVIENQLKGTAINQIELQNISRGMEVKFTPAKGMSSEYIRHLMETQLERGLYKSLKT